MRQNSHTGSRLFFIEFLIVLFFFLIISTVCLKLFARSHQMTREADVLFHAQNLAASVAEAIEADDGSGRTIPLCFPDAVIHPDSDSDSSESACNTADSFDLILYFNQNFHTCAETDAVYTLMASVIVDNSMKTAQICVYASEKELIYELPVSFHIPLTKEGGAVMRKTSGLSLLLLIFLSLCLITFSLLSVSESAADRNLSSKTARRTTEYYAAETKANELLAQIDTQLARFLREVQKESEPEHAYRTKCLDLPNTRSSEERFFSEPITVSWEENAGHGTLRFAVWVTDSQILQTELTLTSPEEDADTLYQISSWKIVNTREWSPDTSQNLYRTDSDTKTANY